MWSDSAAVNRLAVVIALIAGTALLWCAYMWVGNKNLFLIQRVLVQNPLEELDAGLLEAAIRTELRGTFFSLSPARARAALRKLPWVRDAVVKRKWPLTLEISIEEYQAVGYWGDNDLLSGHGEIFRAGSKTPMPKFDGPQSNATEALTQYKLAKLALAPLGLDIKNFSISPRGAITLVTVSNMQLDFGRDQFKERLERFSALFQDWPTQYRAGINRVDMRYKAAVSVAHSGGVAAITQSLKTKEAS